MPPGSGKAHGRRLLLLEKHGNRLPFAGQLPKGTMRSLAHSRQAGAQGSGCLRSKPEVMFRGLACLEGGSTPKAS